MSAFKALEVIVKNQFPYGENKWAFFTSGTQLSLLKHYCIWENDAEGWLWLNVKCISFLMLKYLFLSQFILKGQL